MDADWEYKLISFIRMCKLLESKNLISFVSNSQKTRKENLKYMHKERGFSTPSLHMEFYSVSIDLIAKIIIAFPALNEFIDNDFRTDEEIAMKEEKDARNYALKITKVIAGFSLLLTAAIGIAQICISVFSQPKVHIESIRSDILKNVDEHYHTKPPNKSKSEK